MVTMYVSLPDLLSLADIVKTLWNRNLRPTNVYVASY